MSTQYIVADKDSERTDVLLARSIPEYSRSYLQKLCEQGKVTSNNRHLKNNDKVHTGQKIEVEMPDKPDFSNQSLPIIYEDDDVIVVNKPSGILTHSKGKLNEEFSVAEFLRDKTTDCVDTNRPGIVHRLDRGTSGVLITAKNNEAKRWLQKQFSERKTKKSYIALVEGKLKEKEAHLDLPIERNPKKPQTFRVGVQGKIAITHYETMQEYPNNTLIKLRPKTGRTHQLRVHMSYLNHPIVGDELYGASRTSLERFFLHAYQLEITLPNRERKVFEAPLPDKLNNYLSTL